MNPRRPAISVLFVLLALTLTSCGATRRAGKDLSVALLSPGIILYGGGTDGYASAKDVRDGFESGPFLEVLVMPFTFTFNAIKHTLYCGIYAVDFVLYPVYGVAELFPNGPVVEPLDYYTGTWWDLETDGQPRSGTDPSSGEDLPPNFNLNR